MEKKKKRNFSKEAIRERFNRGNIISGSLVCLALSFTFAFFSPIDIFLASQVDFIVGYEKVIFPMLITAIVIFCGLFSLLIIFLFLKEEIFTVFKNLFLGILLAMYTQMIFFNGRMSSLTGDDYAYSEKNFYNYANLFIYIMIIFIPIFVWYAKIEYSENRFLKKITSKTVTFLSAALIAVQLIGTVSMIFSYGLKGNSDNDLLGMLSLKESMKLSEDENTVVFLTDRLDSFWMDEVVEEYPEVKDMLKGFTFYQNNISPYTNTFPAVPEMLTSYKFEGQLWSDYLSEAWGSDCMLKKIKSSGYRVNLLIDGITTYNTFRDIKDIADNYKTIESGYSINYLHKSGIVPTMLDFSLLKISPYFIKAAAAHEHLASFANGFFEMHEDIPERLDNTISFETDRKFYEFLKKEGLNTDSDEKTFSFVHLNGAHETSTEASALNPSFSPEESLTDEATTIRGELEILNEYFSQMKDLGIYDSSTIIILGDHGRPPYTIQDGQDQLDDCIVTGLLIKEANAELLPLNIDSSAELTNEYFNASIMEYCGLDHSQYGLSYNDVIKNNVHSKRLFNAYNWRGSGSAPELVCQYYITDNARDFRNWEYVKIK